MLKSKNAGFTIVELLIVIVVIGILAAITIVAFNGVQNRAKDAAQVTLVSQWESILKLYVAEHGALPVMSESLLCLGDDASYAANSQGFEDGKCYLFEVSSIGGAQEGAIDPAFMAEMAKVATIPKSNFLGTGKEGSTDGNSGKVWMRGVLLVLGSDGSSPTYTLKYGVSGSKCPNGDVLLDGDTYDYDNPDEGTSMKGNLCGRLLQF